jgi:hypothetical protein
MMFPGPKLSTVFASRWNALLWAGGVLLTAYCSIPEPDKSQATDTPPATAPWDKTATPSP